MARGKSKFKGRRGNKGQKFAGKKRKKTKTYSLFDKKNATREQHDREEPDKKRQKIEKFVPPIKEESSSESEEEENHMQKLLMTFKQDSLKKSVAIDSDSSDLEEELNEECEGDLSDLEDNSTKEFPLDLHIKSNELHDNDVNDKSGIDIETQAEEDVGADAKDSFSEHILYDLSESLLDSLQKKPVPCLTTEIEWKELGSLKIQIPEFEQSQSQNHSILGDNKPFAPMGKIPTKIKPKGQSTDNLFIKSQIINNLSAANKPLNQETESDSFFTPLQSEIFSVVNNYQDFYYPKRSLDNGEEIRFVYCLHAVNHILKTRTKILHHNAKLTQKDDVPEEFRDQGLVRPKVLILAPFRDSAYRIVNFIINILFKEDKGNVINKVRFIEEFTGHELTLPKKNPKPEDYEKLFAGNSGDEFKIGLTITKKSLKLFADFYSSDIIIASPLGLRTIIGAQGEPDRDYDFLASLEILILDQTEIFLMQNWDHVLHIFNHIHLQPKDSHGTDFSRVRTWALNGWSKYYRQTLIFSSVVLPEINAIFNNKCFNYAGKVRAVNPVKFGTICQVYVQLPHVFQKFYAENVIDTVEERFKFFVCKIVPQHMDALMRQTLIYVTNYFDFVRLRNHFKREDIGFVQICEYSKEGKVARARDMFFHGDAHFLLYTERFHFFNRIRIKGIRHLIFYSPPTVPHFYYEMCNLMQESNMNKKVGSMSNMTVTVLYSKYDINQLSAIVGTERAVRMIGSERNVHMLVTDAKNTDTV